MGPAHKSFMYHRKNHPTLYFHAGFPPKTRVQIGRAVDSETLTVFSPLGQFQTTHAATMPWLYFHPQDFSTAVQPGANTSTNLYR